ncbi:cytochrome P450 [Boeremia exigua]|uniref:cytochrome P450 n=1 Tax=Boeremia exigua TaxID=749465 RepID=UPI001E8DB9F1|nr:cytochrome P450 [Boeremia exigua]KAH6618822.1 cytochrome P450 [Boeremia exigua]
MSLIIEDGVRSFLQAKWLLSALLAYIIWITAIYPFLLSPVKHIPGPWYARISKLPLGYATFQKRRTEYVTSILNRYGPVAVIAPDQIHTTDDVAMKAIYDKTAIKTSFYSSMGRWKGVTSTLGFLDYASAAPSRNNLIQCFQNKNLATLVENIQSHVEDFLKLIDEKTKKNEAVDGVVVFRLLALDIVTDVLWGERDRLLHNYQEDQSPIFIQRFHAFSTWNAMKSFIPGSDTYVKYLGNKKWKGLRDSCNDMDLTAKDALRRWEASKDDINREKDVLSMLQSMNNKAVAVPTEDIPAYMVEMLAAGSSTTSHTAAFACWLLARHPKVQDKLYKELSVTFGDRSKLDIRLAMDLPLLDGIIRETMRMYPMIPGPLERHLGKDLKISGYLVPKGVIASTSALNQGQLDSVYPQPNQWLPERWIDADERMKLNWIPFGTGCRSCPGSNLALTELKYMMAMIILNFISVVPDNMENDELHLADVFAAGSKSGHCWLKFERRVVEP